MKILFSKMHGLGNDFVIINNLAGQIQLTGAQIQLIADRRVGVGCDQVLLVDPATDGASDFFYRIYNSDGSLALQCGNGARCFIKFVIDNDLTDSKELKLQTKTRVIHGKMLDDGRVAVDMGLPDFTPSVIGLNIPASQDYWLDYSGRQIRFAALSMGNPHAVIFVDDHANLADDQYLGDLARFIQDSQLFEHGVNVNFVYIKDKNELYLRTYERGCGFTQACGSGACASFAVANRDQRVNDQSLVIMAGGELQLAMVNKEIIMTGAAVHVFDGELQL